MALSLKAELAGAFADVEIELIEGSGGVFEVIHDGNLIFSKKELRRFPEKDEILKLIGS